MSSKTKSLLLASGLLLTAGAFFVFNPQERSAVISTEEEVARVGAPAPDFVLKDVDGKTVRLAQFRGKNTVFLNFWASWCPACREEAPQNEKLYRQLAPKGLVLLAVSIDRGPGAAAAVKRFTQEFNLSFAPLLDAEGQVFEHYGVTAIPTTFLIDREGKIVAKEVGPKNWANADRLKHLEGLIN